MSYELAIITGFTTSNTKEVMLKVRGRALTTAVDVAEITRRMFMRELSICKITIGTEEIPREEVEQEMFQRSKSRKISTKRGQPRGKYHSATDSRILEYLALIQ